MVIWDVAVGSVCDIMGEIDKPCYGGVSYYLQKCHVSKMKPRTALPCLYCIVLCFASF